jgi:hypothetical protein
MRLIDASIKARLLQAQQTLYNHANPWMRVSILHPETPIKASDLWSEGIITAGVTASSTSITVRKTGYNPDKVYVAYIVGTDLIVKSATLLASLSAMVWTTEETIANCLACALEFDGSFSLLQIGMVELVCDILPWLFYVTDSGAVMGGILGGEYAEIVDSGVTALDAVRGFRSRYGANDQGLMVFYVSGGVVRHKDMINGEWSGASVVSIAPADAVLVHAERTIDWRIVLQVTDNTGALYEVFSTYIDWGWGYDTEPTIREVILAGSDSGNLYQSNNHGITWAVVSNLLAQVNVLLSIPYIGLVAATDDSLYMTQGFGDNWEYPTATYYAVKALARVIKSTPSVVVLAFAGSALYKSSNYGQTWSLLPMPGGLEFTLATSCFGSILAYSAITDRLYESTDEGLSFNYIYQFSTPLRSLSCIVDTHTENGVQENSSDVIYASTQAGDLLQSNDRGRTWHLTSGGCGGYSIDAMAWTENGSILGAGALAGAKMVRIAQDGKSVIDPIQEIAETEMTAMVQFMVPV